MDLAKAKSEASIYIHLVTWTQKSKTNKLQPNQRNPEIYAYSVIDLKTKKNV